MVGKGESEEALNQNKHKAPQENDIKIDLECNGKHINGKRGCCDGCESSDTIVWLAGLTQENNESEIIPTRGTGKWRRWWIEEM